MITVRRGRRDELAVVVDIRRQATRWLTGKGLDQWVDDWPDTQTMIDGFRRDLEDGTTWFATSDDDILAIITIDTRTEPGLWTPAEAADALFVHRVTATPHGRGRGVGSLLLDFAGQLAEQAGRHWVRLDAWTTNARLHRYYRHAGFRHVRTIAGHHSPSAACFERPASTRRYTGAPWTLVDNEKAL